jgi:hypothetical protein
LAGITRFLPPNGSTDYYAADVIAMLCRPTHGSTEPASNA